MNPENLKSNTDEAILFSHGGEIEDDLPLTQEIINLSDRCSEFLCVNSFITESLAVLVSEHDATSPEIARGARYCVDSLQARSLSLKAELNQFRLRYLETAREANPPRHT